MERAFLVGAGTFLLIAGLVELIQLSMESILALVPIPTSVRGALDYSRSA
jgi:hypothetical protein